MKISTSNEGFHSLALPSFQPQPSCGFIRRGCPLSQPPERLPDFIRKTLQGQPSSIRLLQGRLFASGGVAGPTPVFCVVRRKNGRCQERPSSEFSLYHFPHSSNCRRIGRMVSPRGVNLYSMCWGAPGTTNRASKPSFSIPLKLSVSTFWLIPSMLLRNSPKRLGPVMRSRKTNTRHLLPIRPTVTATGHFDVFAVIHQP